MKFGQNLRLLIGSKCVAGANSCTFEYTTEFEDISTKDSDTKGKVQTPKRKTFNISVEALVINENDSTGYTMSSFLSAILAGSPVEFTFTETSGAQNRTQVLTPEIKHMGMALINDLTIRAENNDKVKLSCKMIGYGDTAKFHKSAK